ncbi:MAG: TetR/AcrR family transcriptional regulator [Oscillospiraceae bacterium]|nr:TetR/AcrR family transcriptional regulator [Oscillospiraceae bacterium]MCL2248320.1 TetR/AcrR family transcriptional regulator [Oscillospiraceae bacterium]
MRKFLSQPQEKQNKIVTAAMTVFGEVGYKKAYVSEIAAGAGISKALIFHYFGNKKGLYSYLVYYTGKIVMTEAQEKKDTLGKDFFDRAETITRFRLSIKKRYPAMSNFMDSVFGEDDEEVAEDIERLLAIAKDMHSKVNLEPGEENMFKSGLDPAHIVNLVSTFIEGVMHMWSKDSNIDEVMKEVTDCLEMLRRLSK